MGVRNSYAPMPQAGPCGRGTPRWSSTTLPKEQFPASIAALPGNGPCVAVVAGAFTCKGPRLMLALLLTSVGSVSPQLLLLTKLCPTESETTPLQFGAPTGELRIEFPMLTSLPRMMSMEKLDVPSLTTVLLTRDTMPE